MPQKKIDKVFAENLGAAMGGCVRDQISAFTREISNAAGVKLSALPFIGKREKVIFKARWAALLQGVACWVAADSFLEFRNDPKLLPRFSSTMESYADQALEARILSKLDERELRDYALLKQRFLKLALAAHTDKELFARAFLSAVWGRRPADFDTARVASTASMVGLAASLFQRLAQITRESEIAYTRREAVKPANRSWR